MNDREKLTKLLEKHEYQKCYPSTLAAILIAHGVVVREKGEWITDYAHGGIHNCSVCGKWCGGGGCTDFCPNCGADMRIEEQNRARSDCDSSGICIECWDEVDLFYGSSPCVDLPVGKERNK